MEKHHGILLLSIESVVSFFFPLRGWQQCTRDSTEEFNKCVVVFSLRIFTNILSAIYINFTNLVCFINCLSRSSLISYHKSRIEEVFVYFNFDSSFSHRSIFATIFLPKKMKIQKHGHGSQKRESITGKKFVLFGGNEAPRLSTRQKHTVIIFARKGSFVPGTRR